MSQLKIFVSSTCYDLAQIRKDLSEFFSTAGYAPVLSEYRSFPIDPSHDTITNCIENVKRADILVLIIGGRYGSQLENGKSITNTEYLYARENQIPVYVFIKKDVCSIMPVWSDNKDGNFSKVVDDVKVFEFITQVRNIDRAWCFEFDNAQDITDTLRIQLQKLFFEALHIKKKMERSNGLAILDKISPTAIGIAISKEEGFELDFFSQVLKDELEKFESSRFDLDYDIPVLNYSIHDTQELIHWIDKNIHNLMAYAESLKSILNRAFPQFYGELGTPSDLNGLYYVANAAARIYKELITWSLTVKGTFVPDEYIYLRDHFSKSSVRMTTILFKYPNQLKEALEEAKYLKKIGSKETTKKGNLTFDLDQESFDLFRRELVMLQEKYKT